MVQVPLELLGLADATAFEIEDPLSGERYTREGTRAYARIDPAVQVGQIFRTPHRSDDA